MSSPRLPDRFALPVLPAGLEAWFDFAREVPTEAEVRFGEAVLDGLRVVDSHSARLALEGYRFTWHDGVWSDASVVGCWPAHWIVIDAIEADPFIVDLSSPDLPVLTARHGEGAWRPHPVAHTLAAFVAALEVVSAPGADLPFEESWLDTFSVWAIDLGASPLKTLVQLHDRPVLRHLSREDLLALRTSLPALIVDGVSRAQADAYADDAARHGATFQVRPGHPPADV